MVAEDTVSDLDMADMSDMLDMVYKSGMVLEMQVAPVGLVGFDLLVLV
jgi:hypothetical protein